MSQSRFGHMTGDVIALLVYHVLLLLAAACLVWLITGMLDVWGPNPRVTSWDLIELFILSGISFAIFLASCGVVFGNPRGMLLGIVCHVILCALALAGFGTGLYVFISLVGEQDREVRAWTGLALLETMILVVTCLLVGLPSAWAVVRLRRLRKALRALNVPE